MAQLSACIARHPQTRLHFPSTRRSGDSPSQAAGATALTVAPARAAAPAVDPTIAKWEAGAGPNGPVATLLSLLAVGCDRYPLGEEIISAGDASH